MGEPARIPATLLLVEDDASLVESLVRFLGEYGYRVWAAGTGAEAEAILARTVPDLIILDLILPDVDGLILCSRFKTRTSASVIISSGRLGPLDRALSISVGADDFLAKPFDMDDLLARIDAILHRREAAQLSPPGQLHVGELTIEPWTGRATVAGRLLLLTPTQFRLLVALATQPGEIVDRATLLTLLWENEPGAESSHLLDVHISRLRRRLAAVAQPAPTIVTVKGRGYVLAAHSAAGRGTGPTL